MCREGFSDRWKMGTEIVNTRVDNLKAVIVIFFPAGGYFSEEL